MASRRQTARAAGRTAGLARRAPSADEALCEDRAIVVKIIYWLAVLAISLALVVGLILLLEARDESSVGTGLILLSSP
jgi:hypothetical protein